MKRSVKCIIVIILMAMAFVFTGKDVSAAEIDDFKEISNLENYGVTVPDAYNLRIRQIDATSNFKRVKKVGKNVTSAYIPAYIGGTQYQVYVIPYGVKVGNKKYKGTPTINYYYIYY